MFRKSCADLQKMKDEIKFINENIDKSGNNSSNDNIIKNKGGKMKLNPLIFKRENNQNFIGNKAFFIFQIISYIIFDNFHLLNENNQKII